MRLVFKLAQGGPNIDLRAVFDAGRLLAEHFAQPAVNPGVIEEFAQFVTAMCQRKADAIFDVAFVQRQRLIFTFRPDTGFKGQTDAVRVAVLVRLLKGDNLHARPVIRATNKGARRIEAQEGQRQPDAVQQRKGLLQREAELRLHHFRRGAGVHRQHIFAVLRVEVQAQQWAVSGLADKFARQIGIQLRRQRKVEELNATVLNQRHIRFKISDRCQHHHLLSRFIVIGNTVLASYCPLHSAAPVRPCLHTRSGI